MDPSPIAVAFFAAIFTGPLFMRMPHGEFGRRFDLHLEGAVSLNRNKDVRYGWHLECLNYLPTLNSLTDLQGMVLVAGRRG